MPDATRDDRLLLFSLADFGEILLTCLDVAGARSVVEVGSEDGLFTRELARWASATGARISCVEPAPKPELVAFCERSPQVELLRQTSTEALSELSAHDAYFLDGDHNYYTVGQELSAIDAATWASGRPALVFLHDVGWPSGRRDMYYAPDALPAEAVHPYTYDEGVLPGVSESGPGGFRGEGQFAWARVEGGPRNGVLTAIEDFLGSRPHLAFVRVPCIFGLGVLFSSSAPYADALRSTLAPYDDNPLLERLEHNRLTLYLRVLQLQDDLVAVQRQVDEMREVEAENRALRARIEELEQERRAMIDRQARVREEVDTVIRARSFAVAERLSRLHQLFGDQEGVSRARLRAVLDDAASSDPAG